MSLNQQIQSEQHYPSVFRISPLIRITLLSLHVALTIPLPFLAQASSAPVPPLLLWLGIALGAVALGGALSERVILDEEQIQVSYPLWVRCFFAEVGV